MQSILIPADHSAQIMRRLSRLAAQCGATVEQIPGQTIAYRRDEDRKIDTTRAVVCDRVTIGDMPRVNGYTLIGKLTHTGAGNLIKMAPSAQGHETPVEWRTCEPTCDHCGVDRRRNETFLVQCPDGSIKRVGRNCLADFLATNPAGFLAQDAFDDVIRSLSDEWESDGGFGGWSGLQTTTLHYVACATQATRTIGFLKSGSEREPTRFRAAFLSGPCTNSHPEAAADWRENQPTADDTARAAIAIQWALESSESSDYAHNLRVAASHATIDQRWMGILASLPHAYNRAMGQVAERAAKAARPDAGHLGSIGERIDTMVTVERVKAFDSLYGTKLMIAMRTDTGHTLVTFTTGRGCCDEDVGKRFEIRGTVKEHGEYQGRAQTVLSRVKFEAVD